MNSVSLIGRLTRDPDVRWTQDQMAIANFAIAIDRPPKKDGTREADFPRITVFGRQAENCEKYLKKGRLVGITGHIQTGSYQKDGQTIYTTDVVADRVEFLEWDEKPKQTQPQAPQVTYQQAPQNQYQPQQNYSGGYGQPGQFVQPNPQFSATTNPAVVPSNQYPNQQQMPVGFETIQDDDIPF